jgi:quinol-cytochrome oxidoreductase complex cytochrome b subunit
MKENLSEQLYTPGKYPRDIYVFRYVYKWLRLIFEKITESNYNPVSNAGTLAVLFFSIVIVSGFYLIFFYKLATPYESIVTMQNNVVFLRWVRAIHRYTSDAAVVAIVLHIFKMLAQGRSWGPRLLSWITGVIMTGLLFFSAYTGYVLVWDEHAKIIGIIGVKIMNIIPVMPESLLRTFSGEVAPDDGFFFLVIFLHLAVPLFMVFGVWLHTSRISRPKYFFNKRISAFYTTLFVFISIIIPAPLLLKADLFSISLNFPIDAFYSFFLYFPATMTPLGFLLLLAGFNALLLVIPWYFKPSLKISKEEYVSVVDVDLCHGCKQCYYDCPFDAIDMTESEKMMQKPASGKAESSMNPVINPVKCVSCGLCAASCTTFAIGPKDRTGRDLLHQIKEFENLSKKYFVFACSHNDQIKLPLSLPTDEYDCFEVSCAGVIHSTHLYHVARRYEKIFIISCAESNCTFRQGPAWLNERIDGKRVPHLIEAGDDDKIIRLTDLSQWNDLPADKLFLENSQPLKRSFFSRLFSSKFVKKSIEIVFGLLLITGIAAVSRLPLDHSREHDQGMLKLSWKMQGERAEKCREFTDEEVKRIPIHMRKKNKCEVVYLPYVLKIHIDGKEIVKPYKPGGYRQDRPMLVYEEMNIEPGEHFIEVEFFSVMASRVNSTLKYQNKTVIEKDRVVLITIENSELISKIW